MIHYKHTAITFNPFLTILSSKIIKPSNFPVSVLIGFIKKPPFERYCLPKIENNFLSLSDNLSNLPSDVVRSGSSNLNLFF